MPSGSSGNKTGTESNRWRRMGKIGKVFLKNKTGAFAVQKSLSCFLVCLLCPMFAVFSGSSELLEVIGILYFP